MTEQDEAVRLLREAWAAYGETHTINVGTEDKPVVQVPAEDWPTWRDFDAVMDRVADFVDRLATPPPVPAAPLRDDLCPDCGHHLHRPESCEWYDCACEAVPAAPPLDVEFAQAIVDQPEYADGFNTCNFCQYAPNEGSGHDEDCVYVKARELLARPVQDYERLGRAIHAAKKIGGPWGAACGYTNEANVYVEVEYNGGPPGEYACECESMARHLIELQQ